MMLPLLLLALVSNKCMGVGDMADCLDKWMKSLPEKRRAFVHGCYFGF